MVLTSFQKKNTCGEIIALVILLALLITVSACLFSRINLH